MRFGLTFYFVVVGILTYSILFPDVQDRPVTQPPTQSGFHLKIKEV